MGQKPIEGSNPSLSAIFDVNSAQPVSVAGDGHQAGIRTRDIDKGARGARARMARVYPSVIRDGGPEDEPQTHFWVE